MKKQLSLLAFFLLASFATWAQSNIVIFSEDGDAFTLYVNGVKQNEKFETNVKVTGLSGNASLRIEFEDKTKPQLKQPVALESGMEYSMRIKRNKDGELKLRPFGITAIGANNTSSQVNVANEETLDSSGNNTAGDNTQMNTNMSVNTNMNANTNTGSNPNNTSVNVSMPGANVNVNVSTSGWDDNSTKTNATANTKVTETRASSSSATANNNTNVNTTSGTTCTKAMSADNFSKMKETISSKPFSDNKMSTAKVATKNACLSTSQVKEICKLFSMDEEKLAYAKYAYNYCTDKNNYYQVSEVFSFSSTTEDFNKFLEQ